MIHNTKTYVKKIGLIVALVLVVSIGWFGVVSAEGQADKSAEQFSYVFHLYFSNGQLFVDKGATFVYDNIPEQFSDTSNTIGSYRAVIVSVRNTKLAELYFEPHEHLLAGANEGPISVKAPYFADAARVVFYDPADKQQLVVDVSRSSSCNDNGVCEASSGETYNNCRNDCTIAPPPTATPTGGTTGIQTKPSRASALFSTLIPIIIGIVLIVILIILRKRLTKSAYG